MNRIRLNLDRKTMRSYDIHVGRDILDRAGLLLAKNNWAARYVIVSDSRVASLYGGEILDLLLRMDLKTDLIDFPEGEASKTVQTRPAATSSAKGARLGWLLVQRGWTRTARTPRPLRTTQASSRASAFASGNRRARLLAALADTWTQ